MKIGDLIKLSSRPRRNGTLAGKIGLIVDVDKHNNPIICVEGMIKAFHPTQVGEVLS